MYGFSTDDLRKRFSEHDLIDLTAEEGSNVIDEEKITQAIKDGEDEFNLAASRYYVIPVAPLPDAVRKKILDLISYQLVALKPAWLNDRADGQFWMTLRKRLDKWLDGLKSENRLDVIPGAGEPSAPAVNRGGKARVVTDTPVYPEENQKAF